MTIQLELYLHYFIGKPLLKEPALYTKTLQIFCNYAGSQVLCFFNIQQYTIYNSHKLTNFLGVIVSYLIENTQLFVEYRILMFAEAAVITEGHQVPTDALKYRKQ